MVDLQIIKARRQKRKSTLIVVLKLALLIAALLAGLILTAIGVRTILMPLVSATFGIDIVKSSLFYLAVVALSLIFYLVLLVFAVLTWERFNESLRLRFLSAFKHLW
jgi:hypothetical protein